MSLNPTSRSLGKKSWSVDTDESTATFRSSWENMRSMYAKMRAASCVQKSAPHERTRKGKERWGRTSIEAVAISARAADALIALIYKEVDLFNKGSRAPFVLCTECAQCGELRDRWLGRWDSIVQVVLRILSIYTLCWGPEQMKTANLIQLIKLCRS